MQEETLGMSEAQEAERILDRLLDLWDREVLGCVTQDDEEGEEVIDLFEHVRTYLAREEEWDGSL